MMQRAKHPHTVLVVDDEPDVVQSVHDLLRMDYRVLGATRAEEGMKILQREEVHIIMTDQRMPEVTGVEFLSRVRGEHPNAIRLIFTGYADMRAVIDSINLGNVWRYITKPWDPDELQAIIREAAERFDLILERKRLLDEVQRKNRELEDANVRLAHANELKLQFIRVASHELRTPLTILLGLSQLAVRSQQVPPDWPKRILVAGERLGRLVEQIVTMLVAEQFERTLRAAPEDLAPLLAQAAEDVRPFTELRGQSLVVDVAPGLAPVSLEREKIRDSVNHLLLNAIKFTPDGGNITLAARPSAGGVEIEVRDSGVGIDAESLPRIFDPFFTQWDSAHHTSGRFEFGSRGLGLGLSVVKAFVEMHGGRVLVDTTVGAGTTFTITLPAT